MEQHNIFCGGLKSPNKSKPENVLELDVQGDSKNIEFKVESISKAMMANIPDELLDLLEIAAYVYCADQRCSRGSDILKDYGSQWRRVMNFKIPVRKPDVWNGQELKKLLKDTLAFLSDETYEFEFVAATTPLAEKQGYFDFADNLVDTDEIALFSGGLDSFSGAVEGIIGQNRKMTLVGHHSSDKVKSVQKNLVLGLAEKGHGQKVNYISVAVRNKNSRAIEYTQRTRSFLFACLAACITHMLGKDRFTFYENGVVSLNLPITKDIIGGRATRTTHPKVIEGFRQIFSHVLGKDIKIDHPFQWLTKKEIVLKINEHGVQDLLVKTNSCTRPRIWTEHQKHCGMCSQCIDRRFGILAANMGQHEDASNYMVDLLLADRSQDEDNGMVMAASYVKFAQHFISMTKERFISEYPAISPALRCFAPLTTSQAEEKIFDMFQRHSRDVIAVLDKSLNENRAALLQNPSPIAPGCLLALAFNRSKIEPVKPDNYDSELKDTLDNLKRFKVQFFAVDDGLVFKGGFKIDGAGFEVIKHLLPSFREGKKSDDFAYITTVKFKELLGDVDDNSFYKRINRLRDDIKTNLGTSHGLVDDFVENQQRQGYRLNPNLREVNSLADLED